MSALAFARDQAAAPLCATDLICKRGSGATMGATVASLRALAPSTTNQLHIAERTP